MIRHPLSHPLLFLLLLYLRPTHAAFRPSDLPGPFLLRRGNCPNFLAFSHTGPDAPPPASVSVLDLPCTSGTLSLDTSEDTLAKHLSGASGIGETLTYLVTESLVCPGITFFAGAIFTFVKADSTTEVNFARAFGRNGTAVAAEGVYVFQQGEEVLVVSDRCLYTRLTAEEIDQQRGECFPSGALVRTKEGVRQIEHARGEVWDGARWTRVIGWTHRDPRHVGPFVEITTSGGAVLTLSNGHFVYTDRGLRTAGRVTPGMHVSNGLVVKVGRVVKRGLYNVQTVSGDVVVDGIRCSTYTSAVEPVIAHALLAPIRFVWLPWGRGLSLEVGG